MSNQGVFLLVEGPDDDRFVRGILVDILQEKYGWVHIYLYAEKKQKTVCDLIRSIKSMGADYIFLSDLHSAPCVSSRKELVKEIFPCIDENNVIIVVAEIECWYLAGIDDSEVAKYKLKNYSRTETFNKEKFNQIIPRRFISRIDFMREILTDYSTSAAISKNASFGYFAEKYCLIEE